MFVYYVSNLYIVQDLYVNLGIHCYVDGHHSKVKPVYCNMIFIRQEIVGKFFGMRVLQFKVH